MIIPSIDLCAGRTVQLEQGETLRVDAGDPRPLATRFGRVGEIAVIDLDAARREGTNAALVRELLGLAPCRVGGGIRTYEDAAAWLDAGAHRVIIGTAAEPALLRRLPRDRVVAALDARDGEVVDSAWRRRTGRRVEDRIAELRPFVGGFLLTFVEREGCLTGLPLERIAALVRLAGDARVTVAGGVADARDIAEADRLGADAQVGMALYTGRVTLAGAIAACLRSDRADGLWPTVVCDERGAALGLAWSSAESLGRALETGRGIYWSRSRGALWDKGAGSGATQELLRADADCDRDALRFTVRQHGTGFCHLDRRTCFGDDAGLGAAARRIAARARAAPDDSYTARLLADPALLRAKLVEEAAELGAAATSADVAHEAADVLYFALVALQRAGVPLEAVERELDRRALRLTRRPGDAKPAAIGPVPMEPRP